MSQKFKVYPVFDLTLTLWTTPDHFFSGWNTGVEGWDRRPVWHTEKNRDTGGFDEVTSAICTWAKTWAIFWPQSGLCKSFSFICTCIWTLSSILHDLVKNWVRSELSKLPPANTFYICIGMWWIVWFLLIDTDFFQQKIFVWGAMCEKNQNKTESEIFFNTNFFIPNPRFFYTIFFITKSDTFFDTKLFG